MSSFHSVMEQLSVRDDEKAFKNVTIKKLKGSYRKNKDGSLVIRSRNVRPINHNFIFPEEYSDEYWDDHDFDMMFGD